MKRVLVTGATGFIGRACLAPLAARGFEVHAVQHARVPESGEIGWHAADLLAPGAAAAVIRDVRPSHLLHLAWYAVPGKYWTAPENLAWVRASLGLYEAFVAGGGARAVMAGSCAEYAWGGEPLREGHSPLVPRTFYGTCKRALSDIVLASGGNAAWARFFFLYGEREYPERLVPSVIRALLRGEVARCSPGTQRRDFLHVADAAAATVALLDSDVTGPVNIASGAAITVRSLAERVHALIGAGQLDFGALPPDPDPVVAADVRRVNEEVGWTAPADIDDRLRATIAFWSQP